MGHGGTAATTICAARRRPASTARCCFAAFHSDYARRQSRGRADRRQPSRSLLRLRLRPPGRDRGRVAAMVQVAVEELRLRRHQGASPRRAGSRARSARPRARFRLPVLYDVMGEISDGRTSGAGVSRRRVHHSASRQLRRRLARAARADRSPGAASQRLRRHLRRAPLRPARAGGAARGRAQDPVRLGRALAASRRRAREDSCAGADPGRRRRWCWAATSCADRPRAARADIATSIASAESVGKSPGAVPIAIPGWLRTRALSIAAIPVRSAAVGAAQLQRAVGDAEPRRRAVQIAVLALEREPDRRLRVACAISFSPTPSSIAWPIAPSNPRRASPSLAMPPRRGARPPARRRS